MSTTVVESFEVDDLGGLDAAGVLDALSETEHQERRASARKLALAYQWAVLHPAIDRSNFLESPEVLGGDGTPMVAAFTAEPLAVRLRITPGAAAALIGDALDLVHRHPRLWDKVQTLRVPAWQARRVAQQTRRLPLPSARWVDQQLAARSDDACGPVIVDRLVAHITATAEPETHQQREQAAQASWDVTLTHPDPTLFAGTSHLDITGDTLVLHELSDLVDQVAHQLLLDGDHKLRQWVGHHQVTFVPVLNTARGDAVDVHDPPPWMREQVILRDQHCVFPGCTRDARTCDLDHTTPYQPDDPPHSLAGQTHPDNLACLCRRHHRAKTHGPWRYTRTPDGRYVWTGPQAFSKS
ncbi:hypothetical protein ISU07_07005 [Nocardioides islandensis]|uniref:HNH nuclease domain-containing protein n=1 Tax=Nocardioides islandensis TaxID=433663 RepID=A0A930VC56_9ACTN|nr:HNH endonuclease signature motif containing protein [Nocardioides islandensis]MBF4762871.1 hypothetical protein [Nocardioides islandensis]